MKIQKTMWSDICNGYEPKFAEAVFYRDQAYRFFQSAVSKDANGVFPKIRVWTSFCQKCSKFFETTSPHIPTSKPARCCKGCFRQKRYRS